MATIEPDPVVIDAEQRRAPITLETLTARCAQPTWQPDASALVFSPGRTHFEGTEEFRTLRSRLYQIRQQQPLRVVLVTSALPNEGKTFVSANLAQAIVRQHERRALIIDGDMRRGRLHSMFGAPSSPGLADYLRGKSDEFAVIQRAPVDNLFFLPAGQLGNDPTELIGNGRLKSLLHRLSPLFDWIIIDSPPSIPVSDAALLADVSDGVLLVTRAGVTPFDLAQRACKEFSEKRLLGVVLNQADRSSPYDGYGYYYEASKNGGRNGRNKG